MTGRCLGGGLCSHQSYGCTADAWLVGIYGSQGLAWGLCMQAEVKLSGVPQKKSGPQKERARTRAPLSPWAGQMGLMLWQNQRLA